MKNGTELIAKERARQVAIEGWTAEHDDAHSDTTLAWAAVCYAAPTHVFKKGDTANGIYFRDPWPFDDEWDKRQKHGNVVYPNTPFYVNREQRIRQLVKAGALIAAEIDRIQRLPQQES